MARSSLFGTPMQVEGADDLARLLRKIGDRDLKKGLREANKAGAEVVKDRSKRRYVPRQSGRLERSLGVRAGQKDAKVKAGSKARVPYAGVQEFGWARRNIGSHAYLRRALSDKIRDGDLKATYEKEMRSLFAEIERRF